MKLTQEIHWNGKTYTHLDGKGCLWRFEDGAGPMSQIGDEMREWMDPENPDIYSPDEEFPFGMRYFGLPSPGSSWLDAAERMDVPVGKPCCLCNVAIVAEDSGFRFATGPYIHNQCFHQIIGYK